MFPLALAGLLPVLFADPGVSLSEAEFLSAVDADHPAVIERTQNVAAARARVQSASAFENPVLEWSREDPDGPARRTEEILSWQLPGADRGSRLAVRKREVDAAEARCSDDLSELRRELREIYAQWAFAAARRQRLTSYGERVDALADREALRADRGEASGLEVHRLRAAARGLWTRADLAHAEAEYARARAAVYGPQLSPDVRPELPDLPESKAGGGGRHPWVRAAAAELAAAELERRVQKRFVDSPEVSLGRLQEEDGDASRDGLLVGISWSVPVFDRRGGRRAEAEARESAARARLGNVRRRVDVAGEAAHGNYVRLAAAAERAEARLEEDKPMWKAAEAAFRHGELAVTDLLDIQRSAEEAELAALDLRWAALAAFREWERWKAPAPSCTASDLNAYQKTR